MLEALRKQWAAREPRARIADSPRFDGADIVLGAGTRIASGVGPDIDRRAIALLSTAYGMHVDQSALTHLQLALDRRRAGDHPLALIHLALTGLGKLERPQEDARRLFMADGLMKAGVAPAIILDALELDGSDSGALERAYNPDQPRVPAGSGRESGEWTDGTGESAGRDAPPIQIADAAANWAQYLNPIGPAEAAEANGGQARNGGTPNIQHQLGVERAKADYQALGFEIESDTATYVDIPGFSSPRVYDFIALDPETGKYIGVEVKTTYFDTIYLSPSQVDKDVAIYRDGPGYAGALGKFITKVAYEAYCGNCAFLNVRYWYLAFKLAEVGIVVTPHTHPGGRGAPY